MSKRKTHEEFVKELKIKKPYVKVIGLYVSNRDSIECICGYCGYSKNKDKMIDKLNQIQINDNIKNEYCIKNHIRLIRIPYYEFNNIEQILSEVLNIEKFIEVV